MELVRAFANPTRIRILSAIAEGPSTASTLTSQIGEKRGVVDYHLRVLRATGCIQPTDRDQPCPADQLPYELAPGVEPTGYLSSAELRSGIGHPPAAAVRSVIERGMSRRGEDLFGARKNQLSCSSIVVDKQGWREISHAIGEALDRISTAHERSMRRLTESDEEGINATIAVASFASSSRRVA